MQIINLIRAECWQVWEAGFTSLTHSGHRALRTSFCLGLRWHGAEPFMIMWTQRTYQTHTLQHTLPLGEFGHPDHDIFIRMWAGGRIIHLVRELHPDADELHLTVVMPAPV